MMTPGSTCRWGVASEYPFQFVVERNIRGGRGPVKYISSDVEIILMREPAARAAGLLGEGKMKPTVLGYSKEERRNARWWL